MWDNLANGAKIREFETKGSFGMSIDIVAARHLMLDSDTNP